jgi:hypothetical protein
MVSVIDLFTIEVHSLFIWNDPFQVDNCVSNSISIFLLQFQYVVNISTFTFYLKWPIPGR